MTQVEINSWQDVQREVLERINSRFWKPGEMIPTEADLATEFGCARVTVNRGLQALAESGLLDRRRKAGTRVALHPVRKATFNIPILQHEIEQNGKRYDYALIRNRQMIPPPEIVARMGGGAGEEMQHIEALHLADAAPYVFEDRWINPKAVPMVSEVDFSCQSPNKWLVENAPFTRGDVAFSAKKAGPREVDLLACTLNDALFVIERRTQRDHLTITSAKLIFAPGHKMFSNI